MAYGIARPWLINVHLTQLVHDLLTHLANGGVDPKKATLLLGGQATNRSIRRALTDLRRIPADSTIVVHLSGHGTKDGDEAFWVTQDIEFDAIRAHCLIDWTLRAVCMWTTRA